MSMHFNFHNLKVRFGRRRGNESEAAQFGRDARSDWQCIFITFLVINLVSFVGNVFVYRQINNGEIFLVPKKEPISLRVLDRNELKETIQFFESKKARFEALQTAPLIVSGPGPARSKK